MSLLAHVLLLTACAAAPKVPTALAAAAPLEASAAASSEALVAALPAGADRALARRVGVIGPRGRLGQAEREALLRRIGQQGSASLVQRHLAAMSAFGDVDLHAGNDVRLLIDGPATFDALFKAIDAARHSVLIETYIVEDVAIARRLADTLARKRAQGLQVALLYDAIGSFGTDAAYFEGLQRAGVLVCAFNPLTTARERKAQSASHRDHRKIVVVDRQIGFAGGINISAVYSSGSFGRGRSKAPVSDRESGWRDTHLQLRGPAVAALDDLVRDSWREQGCPDDLVIGAAHALSAPAGPQVVRVVPAHPDDEFSRIYALLLTAIDSAERSIHVTMAYFAPGDEMIDALCEAARRGVDVQLVLPSRSDFRPVLYAGQSRYERLLEAGVKVHELQGAVLHAKTAVIDGVLSTVGSSNMDYRSFVGNNEINVVVLGEDFGDAMARMFKQDLAASRAITLHDWQQRPLSQRLLEVAARVFERWW